ncbi:hypothetical protein, partial [Campylobacter sp.]|uniref:hypothetical protein n=1 Tax=Campylobacter sp. TaxID=205 RepID=UPI0026DAE626
AAPAHDTASAKPQAAQKTESAKSNPHNPLSSTSIFDDKALKMQKAQYLKEQESGRLLKSSAEDLLESVLPFGLDDLAKKGANAFFGTSLKMSDERDRLHKAFLQDAKDKIARGLEDQLNLAEREALYKRHGKGLKQNIERERKMLEIEKKQERLSKEERDLIEDDLGFFNTLFNDDKDTIREFKDAYKSEGIISADVQKAINVLEQFEESGLLRHIFSDKEKKQELQQEYLKNALIIAELNGFDDVGLSKENELYFIKNENGKEQKYLVNTGFFDNFWDFIENAKFEIAGAFAGGVKGFNSGKSAKGKVVKSVLGAAAGSFGGGLMDAKIADMYLNRESNYRRNLEYALQAGLLSIAGDGVFLAAKPIAKGAVKGVKNAYAYAKERTPLGFFSTILSQNISAANKIIDEVFSPEMKEELKAAQKEFGGSVRGEDLASPVFEKLKESFAKKYGKEDAKTQKIAKLAEIFNVNSLKTKQQEMLDLIRSDKDGSTLAYLLEVAKDDVKIQNNLKNMLNFASANVEKNLKNLNIDAREIKQILDEFEAGNKAAFKEVENQISKLYNEDIRVVLDRTHYENIKKDFLENGVNLDEMTPFLRDLENNVFAKEGVTFAKLNNFRKNLNFYIFNKDKTPNFINTLKKITETSLKAEIDRGIDNIFKELPKAYESIKELYSTSLKDYAAMKELNESIKNLKLQDSAKSADEVVKTLIKYAKGQGENGVNNLQKIKDYLGEENNAFLEMQILNRLFKESVIENDRAKVRVFDSEDFLNKVKSLVGDTQVFKSEEAREFLELVDGFHKLYKNDALIAKNFAHATSERLGTSIATTAEGAIKQKLVKGAFDPIFRLLPDGILFGIFSKQIQGGALRYHLRKALSRSLNYDDFKIKLEGELKRTNFNSSTSRLIEKFMDNLEAFNAEKEAKIAKMREEESGFKNISFKDKKGKKQIQIIYKKL